MCNLIEEFFFGDENVNLAESGLSLKLVAVFILKILLITEKL